jgi:hypothetical protein
MKYKRCCLPREEAARRTQLQGPAQAAGPRLDVSTIQRVRYARGLDEPVDSTAGRQGLRVSEWSAPVPLCILEAFERERVEELEGHWGDARIGRPVQLDRIDVETDTDLLTIEVANRAICLVASDDEELRRIHRVCVALDKAEGGEVATLPAAAESRPARFQLVASAEPVEVAARREEAAEVWRERDDLATLKKQHRRLGGTCALCGAAVTRRTVTRHLEKCAPAHDAAKGTPQQLVRVRVTAPGLPAYWLDVEARADARLSALDGFLRQIWLECCGHLSRFEIGAVDYFSPGFDLRERSAWSVFGQRRPARSMNVPLAGALPAVGQTFTYEYDFGSTTHLSLTVAGERLGRVGRTTVRLLARNQAPVWPCGTCGGPATGVCPYCLAVEAPAFSCDGHQDEHRCGEEEAWLPVVNSPRMGVCGYEG